MRKIRKVLDRQFFVVTLLLFLGTFGGSFAFSWRKISHWPLLGGGTERRKILTKEEKEELGKKGSVLGEKREGFKEEDWEEKKTTASFDSTSWQEEGKKAVDQLTDSLQENNPFSFYELFGEDLKGMFALEEVKREMEKGPRVAKVEVLFGPKISGHWMESGLRLQPEEGEAEEYIAVFHLEDGKWKLFGTEPLDNF